MKKIRLDHTTTLPQLNWLLAQALGLKHVRWESDLKELGYWTISPQDNSYFEEYAPTKDPRFIIDLIKAEGISLHFKYFNGQWVADLQVVERNLSAWEDRRFLGIPHPDYRENPTQIRSYIRADDSKVRGPEIAAVRCFLAAVYNDLVEVPDELA